MHLVDGDLNGQSPADGLTLFSGRGGASVVGRFTSAGVDVQPAGIGQVLSGWEGLTGTASH